MPKKQKNLDKEHVEKGMVVEATKGDLGEEDFSKPKVSDVTRNRQVLPRQAKALKSSQLLQRNAPVSSFAY